MQLKTKLSWENWAVTFNLCVTHIKHALSLPQRNIKFSKLFHTQGLNTVYLSCVVEKCTWHTHGLKHKRTAVALACAPSSLSLFLSRSLSLPHSPLCRKLSTCCCCVCFVCALFFASAFSLCCCFFRCSLLSASSAYSLCCCPDNANYTPRNGRR